LPSTLVKLTFCDGGGAVLVVEVDGGVVVVWSEGGAVSAGAAVPWVGMPGRV
jgi:hypothetical protein